MSEPIVSLSRRSVSVSSRSGGLFEFTNGSVRVQARREGAEEVRAVDLLLASLGMCIAGTIRAYASGHGIDGLESATVEVRGEEVGPPTRLARAEVTIRLDGQLSDQDRQRLERAGAHCKIHTTLSQGVEVTIQPSFAQ